MQRSSEVEPRVEFERMAATVEAASLAASISDAKALLSGAKDTDESAQMRVVAAI